MRLLRSELAKERMADPEKRAAISDAMKARWKDPVFRQRMLANRKNAPKINDGLTKVQRYRLKDIEAYRKKKAAWARTPEQRAKRREQQRRWREKNRARHNELARQSHQRNKHKHIARNMNHHLLKSFGITVEQKKDMVIAQQGLCLICSEPFASSRSTHVDHCHATGKVRGILCHRCNTKLGWFERYKDVILAYVCDTIRCVWCGWPHDASRCWNGPAHREAPAVDDRHAASVTA